MEVELLTKGDLAKFKEELLYEIRSMLSHPAKQKKEWLKSPDVRKMLGISATTLQTLRIKGILPHTKIGGTLYYSLSDIENSLKKNLVSRNGII